MVGNLITLVFAVFGMKKGFTIVCFSFPKTPQQNGLVERKHRHISEMGRTLMIASSVPLYFRAEAICTSVFLINRLPTPTLGWRSPFEALFGRLPGPTTIRVCVLSPLSTLYRSQAGTSFSPMCIFGL